MKHTEDKDGTTTYVIYESQRPSGHGNDDKGYYFICRCVEDCIQALKHYIFTKLRQKETVVVADNIEGMFIDDIPQMIQLQDESTANPHLAQFFSFNESQGVSRMTDQQFRKRLDNFLDRFKLVTALQYDDGRTWNMKDMAKTLIGSNNPFLAGVGGHSHSSSDSDGDDNVKVSLLSFRRGPTLVHC
jgi:hypothetical protein